MKRKISEKSRQKGRYLVFGIANTVINYAMYEALALLVFTGEQQLWLATLISGTVSIFVGYLLHSKFTWKDREVGKKQLAKFFVWNVVMNIAVRPMLTAFFGLTIFNFLYKFAFDICQGIGLPFSYEFVESTGNYVLMTVVVMVINFLVYDKFVFGTKLAKKDEVASDGADKETEE